MDKHVSERPLCTATSLRFMCLVERGGELKPDEQYQAGYKEARYEKCGRGTVMSLLVCRAASYIRWGREQLPTAIARCIL